MVYGQFVKCGMQGNISEHTQCVIGRLEQREIKNELVNDIDTVSFFECYTSERCTLSEDNDANTRLI